MGVALPIQLGEHSSITLDYETHVLGANETAEAAPFAVVEFVTVLGLVAVDVLAMFQT